MAGDARTEADVRTRRRRRALRVSASLLGAAAAGALGWWLGHMAPTDTLGRVLAWLDAFQQANTSPVAMLVVCASFVVAACIGCPINVCIAASMLALGPWRGVPTALAGTLASASLLHRAGTTLPPSHRLGRHDALVRRLRGSVAAIALVRLLPVAPYCVVSLLGGIVRAPPGRYLLGTALGMAPGIVVYALFLDRAQAALRSPHALAAFAAVASPLLLAGAWFACTRAMRRTVPWTR